MATSVPASATTLRTTLGDVSATLTYAGTPTNPRGTTLSVSEGGRVVYHAHVDTTLCGRLCWPEASDTSATASALRVVHLAPGVADVVLSLYSGGAHCCFVDLVLRPVSSTRFASLQLELGDPGARLEVLPGSPDAAFVTADDAFAYAFTDFAASGLPLKVLRLRGGSFVNVTRDYPSLLRADAARWLQAYRSEAAQHYDDSVGLIAAWAADEYLLGRASAANAYLITQAAAGHLHSLLTPSMSGRAFVAELEKFLAARHY